MPREYDDSALTMAELLKAADKLRYLNAPVEARLSAYGLRVLKLMFEPDQTKPPPKPSLLSGVRLIVDPALPPRYCSRSCSAASRWSQT